MTPNTNPAGLGAFNYNLRFSGQYALMESGINYNLARDYDPQTGRYLEPDPMGQRVYFGFSISNLRIASGLKRGYWNHLYNYADNRPISERDSTGLGGIMDLIQEALGEKTPEEINKMSLGAILGALCTVRDCKKSLNKADPSFPLFMLEECYSIISQITDLKGGPAWVGLVQGFAGGTQAMADSCAEKCENNLKKAPCCNGGK